MTGFGRAQRRQGRTVVECEIRTVNHRFFEVAGKLPESLQELDAEIRGRIQGRVRRGRVTLSVSVERPQDLERSVTIDWARARHYRKLLGRLHKTLGLSGDVTVGQVLALPDLWVFRGAESDPRKLWPLVRQAVDVCIAQVERSRVAEGRALAKDLERHVKAIAKSLDKIHRRLPAVVSLFRERLLEALGAPVEQQAAARDLLEKEVPIFAKSCDVSEEVVRMKSHVETFLSALRQDGEAGRRLDFIAQELHRETNTIGSKSADSAISREVIQMKSVIEKIREQVQNVE